MLLVQDTSFTENQPKRFRMFDDKRRLIGSGQFTPSQLQSIQSKLNAPLIVVDLRAESHGFIDDMPVSWYKGRNNANELKTKVEIDQDQQAKLTALKEGNHALDVHRIVQKSMHGTVDKALKQTLNASSVYSEEELARHLGIGYKRFYVTDHTPPSMEQVQAFKSFLKTVPSDTWLYFHCRGGSGRTTTFMVLHDVFKYGHARTLESIFYDHAHKGGKDLRVLPKPSSYKYLFAVARKQLIEQVWHEVQNKKS